MAQATITTLVDKTTGNPVAPKTFLTAISATGTEGQVVGFTTANVLGNIDPLTSADVDTIWTEVFGNG